MIKIMIVASITLASGDVPLLVEKGFRKLGCHTYLLPIDEDLPLREAIFYRKVAKFNRRLFNYRFFSKAIDYQPDIILIYGSNWGIFPKTLKKLKSRLNCKVIVWEGNLNFWKSYQSECFPFYDHFFSGDSYPIPLLKKPATGLKNVHFLVIGCCDPEEHSRVELSKEEKRRYEADITFVGGGRPVRRSLFEQLTDYKLKLWGWGWDESPVLAPCMSNETVFGLKKTKIYSAVPVCPNLQSGLYQVSGVSVRIFEVACCGRLPFSEPQPDIMHFFQLGEEIEIFDNPVELRKKVAYYLKHLDELDRIAECARQRVLAEHTYKHRLKEMLEIVI
jgi:spore maturation protein CgeB